jgi:hypothetical protein
MVTLGWSNLTDCFTIGNFDYAGTFTVSVKSGQAFYYIDENINSETVIVSGTLTTGEIAAIAGKTLRPYNQWVTQRINLNKGWNWISTYIEMDGVDGISMLETSLNGNGLMIKFGIQYTEYDAEWDEWFGNGLTALTNDKMYLVKTSTACEVAFVGTVANIANHPVTIKHGWNWIGFPSDHSMTVEDALTRFTPETGDKIQYGTLFTEYDAEWDMWIGNGLNDLVPGRGYLYYSNSTENKTLIF